MKCLLLVALVIGSAIAAPASLEVADDSSLVSTNAPDSWFPSIVNRIPGQDFIRGQIKNGLNQIPTDPNQLINYIPGVQQVKNAASAGQKAMTLLNRVRSGEPINQQELQEIILQLSGVGQAKDTVVETRAMVADLGAAQTNQERIEILRKNQQLLMKLAQYAMMG